MRIAIYLAVSVALFATSQTAYGEDIDSILKPSLHDRICVEDGSVPARTEGKMWIVDPYLFGNELLRTALFPQIFIDFAEDGNRAERKNRIVDVIAGNKGDIPAPLMQNRRVQTAYETARSLLRSLTDFLKGDRKRGLRGFTFHNVRSRSTPEILQNWLQGKIKIECVVVRGSSLDDSVRVAEKLEKEKEGGGKTFTSYFLIRGQVKDLTIDRRNIKNSSSATIAFKDDRESDEQSFQTNIVVGLDAELFRPADSNWKILPYAHYQLNDNNGKNKEDLHSITTGVLFSRLVEIGRLIDAELGLVPNATFDLKQGAESARFKAFFTPSLTIGKHVYLGGWKRLAGPIHYRPVVSAIAEGAHVFDNGSSTEIKDTDQYYGIGGSAELKLNVRGLPILRDTIFTVRYRHLELFSTALDQAKRFTAEAAYTLDEKKRFTVSLKFAEGENAETFQREEFVSVNLGAKF